MIRAGLLGVDLDGILHGLRPAAPSDPLEPELRLGTRPIGGRPGCSVAVMQGLPEPHLGWLGPLVDLAMGGAYTRALDDGRSCATATIRLEALAPLRPGAQFLAVGMSDDLDRASATVTTVVLQGDVVVAKGSGRFVPVVAPVREGPGRVVSLQEAGLGIAEGFGLRGDPCTPGGAVVFPSDHTVANPRGVVHGGVQIAIAAEAILRSEPGATAVSHEITELTASYLMPAHVGAGSEMSARLTRLHSGSRSFRSRAELTTAEDAVATIVDAAVIRRRAPAIDKRS